MLCVLASWLALAAPQLGVLPVAGDDASSVTEEMVLEAPSLTGVTVAKPQEMARQVATAASLGITCASMEAPCLAKIGALAKVRQVLQVEVTKAFVAAVLIDVKRGALVRRVEVASGSGAPPAATLRAVIDAAVEGTPLRLPPEAAVAPEVDRLDAPSPTTPPATTSPTTPAAHPTPVTPPTAPTAPTAAPPASEAAAERGVPTLVVVGGSLAGLGALTGAGLGVGALLVRPDPIDRADYSARQFNDGTTLATALAIGAGASASVALIGLSVLGLGLLE